MHLAPGLSSQGWFAVARKEIRDPPFFRAVYHDSANGARRPPSVEAWARPHTLCIQAQLLVPRLRLHSFWQSSIHARPPGTRLQRNVGPPPPRSPSRRSQVMVRRGQRWWRQMPQGSSTRSSPRSMAHHLHPTNRRWAPRGELRPRPPQRVFDRKGTAQSCRLGQRNEQPPSAARSKLASWWAHKS